MWLLLLAAAAQASFRCDLSRLPARPAILLIGENHCHEGAKRVSRTLTTYAVEGRLAGAFEGLYPGSEASVLAQSPWKLTSRSRFFGIENPFTHGLVASYFYSSKTRICERNEEELSAGALNNTAVNRFTAQAWREAKRRNPSLAASRPGTLMDRAERGEYLRQSALRQLTADELRLLDRIFNAVHAAYVDMANERLGSLGLSAPLSALAPGRRNAEAAESVERLIIPVRDREMADAIQDIYCASAEDGVMTVAVVGAAHLPGLVRHLTEDSRGAIQIFTRESHRQTEQVLDELRRLADSAYRPAGR